MDAIARLEAVEAIRQIKSRYFRGVDTGDGELVRSILADDCLLDYMGCCTDPETGIDHMPAMNLVLHGRDSWPVGAPIGPRIITVHHGHDPDITVQSDNAASAIWLFTDRFFLPEGGPFQRLIGWGRYYETYSNRGEGWKLQTTRVERIRVEVS